MKIRCIIIDDEPLAIQVIESHLKVIPEIDLLNSYQDPTKAFDVLALGQVDLIFLDIEMPQLSGIELIKVIPASVKVIFTTAYRNYAAESYDLNAVDYLLKPISFSRLYKAINKYKVHSNLPIANEKPIETQSKNDHLYVNSNKKFIKIYFDSIEYVESMKDYVRVFTSDNNTMTKDTIANFEKKLPDSFLRIHRSYIVNSKKITAFTKMDVEIGKKEIPIGASFKEDVMAFLKGTNE
jgi:DNA-binding LytR/AlgR family response regulator